MEREVIVELEEGIRDTIQSGFGDIQIIPDAKKEERLTRGFDGSP